ncbi:MAG TPA: outer membrane protein assembly factor BamA [Allosphingosinicella sp.]|jgi:outer membrane protein insertion porin family
MLLMGTALGALAASPVMAQQQSATPVSAAPAAAAQDALAPVAVQPAQIIRSITVRGNQRLEPETVISYMPLRVGEQYNNERLDESLKTLLATELFADVTIGGADTGNLVVQVRENPVINRIVLEGNKRLKEDKIRPEIRLAPRQIFTRSKVRADVARIVELYRRQGRFAATVEPKIVQLDQNRVDLVFEVEEGPKSRVQQINIIGNQRFSDSELRGEMATKQARITSFFSGNTSYDPDRLAFDQQKLRLFYLTNGYADFRVVSAVAELTPDRRDFIITYVVEEGERYKFGDVKVESEIRDFKPLDLSKTVPFKTGDFYDAKKVEDTVTSLTETAGLFGYAFADVRPRFDRNKDTKTMSVTFNIGNAPRQYVERIDINGNTVTRDKVIRREFRLAEGDPFNSLRVKRSRDRIQSLGFFQDNLEVEQTQGSAPDRVILSTDLEEKSTGELQLSAGFSSLERFLINLSIRQRNFMGKGQELRAGINYSSFSKSIELGFTEPYLFDRNIAVGFDVYRRDYRSFNFTRDETSYEQVTTGGQLRAGVPLTEYVQLALRYGLNFDEINLGSESFIDPDGPGPEPVQCDPFQAGRFLCEQIGDRTVSSLGYSLVYNTLNNSVRPSSGHRVIFSQDFAGLGGSVRYLKSRISGSKYWPLGAGFIGSLSAEGGYVKSFNKSPGEGIDPVRITDRFFLGEGQIRGFDIRGVGPRVIRTRLDPNGDPIEERQVFDEPLGGRAYYLGRAEVEIPLGSGAKELGLRPSVFMDVGAVFGVKRPLPTANFPTDPTTGKLRPLIRPILTAEGLRQCSPPAPPAGSPPGSIVTIPNDPAATCPANFNLLANSIDPFLENFVGNTPKPRVSIGFGVNWNSPFGPFRIDIAKALVKAEGDDAKLITFNVGTAF